MANRYRAEVKSLREAVNDEARRGEAAQLLRDLVEKVELTPNEGAEGLSDRSLRRSGGNFWDRRPWCNSGEPTHAKKSGMKKPARCWIADHNHGSGRSQIKLVAGAGFEPATFGL